MMNLLRDEPVALTQTIAETIRQVIGALVVFNVLTWNETQAAAFMGSVSAVLALATVYFARARSTPNSKVRSTRA
jgi:hypothetical protein